jgi:hypothetical protein
VAIVEADPGREIWRVRQAGGGGLGRELDELDHAWGQDGGLIPTLSACRC